MPRNWGLFDTNIVIKFHKNMAVQRMSEEIYKQISTVSNRDQLAVTYIYYMHKFKGFNIQNLLTAFQKSGEHIRISV